MEQYEQDYNKWKTSMARAEQWKEEQEQNKDQAARKFKSTDEAFRYYAQTHPDEHLTEPQFSNYYKPSKEQVSEDLSNLSKLPQTIRQYLGDTKEELLLRNDQIIQQSREDLTRLRASPEREHLRQLEVENENLAEQPSERDRERMRQNNDQIESLRGKT